VPQRDAQEKVTADAARQSLAQVGNNTAESVCIFCATGRWTVTSFAANFDWTLHRRFACLESNLVVELDGSQHENNPRDAIRNDYMTGKGLSVARFANAAPEPIVETIAYILADEIREEIIAPDFQFYPAKVVSAMNSEVPHPDPLPLKGEKWSEANFMRRAVALTRPGTTWPNPSVGCVIVKDYEVVGEGATGAGGRPHAEEIALAMAGDRAVGATVYVTLEPCGRRSTGVPSCSQRLAEAGVARVVFACADPSPYASHSGVQRMRDAGIIVEHGLLAAEARHLIAPTARFHATGLPLVGESETGEGYDAEFMPESDDMAAELAGWAARGYRHLYVKPGSPLAVRLRTLGYIAE